MTWAWGHVVQICKQQAWSLRSTALPRCTRGHETDDVDDIYVYVSTHPWPPLASRCQTIARTIQYHGNAERRQHHRSKANSGTILTLTCPRRDLPIVNSTYTATKNELRVSLCLLACFLASRTLLVQIRSTQHHTCRNPTTPIDEVSATTSKPNGA